jgi:hypothetical protein
MKVWFALLKSHGPAIFFRIVSFITTDPNGYEYTSTWEYMTGPT